MVLVFEMSVKIEQRSIFVIHNSRLFFNAQEGEQTYSSSMNVAVSRQPAGGNSN